MASAAIRALQPAVMRGRIEASENGMEGVERDWEGEMEGVRAREEVERGAVGGVWAGREEVGIAAMEMLKPRAWEVWERSVLVLRL